MFCRVRPVIREDGTGVQAERVVACDAEDDGVLSVQFKGRPHSFDLDRVFDASVSQEQVKVSFCFFSRNSGVFFAKFGQCSATVLDV